MPYLDMTELNNSTAQKLYSDSFNSHLLRLISIDLAVHSDEKIPILPLSQRRYLGMEQTAMDMGGEFERESARPVDWNAIDRQVNNLSLKYLDLMGEEFRSEYLSPIRINTLSAFENFLIYKEMYPESRNNPWVPTYSILNKGLLFVVSDNEDLLRVYNKEIRLTRFNDEGLNIGLIVKGKRRQVGSFVLDNTYSIMSLVYQYIATNARGLANVKNLTHLFEYVMSLHIEKKNVRTERDVQVFFLTPLKKTGLIGSINKGYFYIESAEDLKASFDFHRTKLVSIDAIMRQYRRRQKEFDGLNLDEDSEES